ncbi:MAG TPA: alpha/beta hydrolase [Caulobacteraceae bacterium]
MRFPNFLRPLARAGAVVGLASALGACSATGALNTLEPKGGVTVTRDLAYADGPRQRLDVYAPSQPAPGRPVVVFFYGGNWDSGAKADYAWVGNALAQQGYVVVLPDYRLYPDVRWPAFLQDSALAVRWARDHAVAYGGDGSRLVLMGHSAGAYNAVDLAVDARWLTAAGVDPHRDIRAVVGLSGPYDFLPLDTDELKDIFGPEAQRPDTQPINHVDGHAAPMLLATGDQDHTVSPGNSDRMAARVNGRGGMAKVIHYPSLDHVRMVASLAAPLRWMAPVLRDVTAFIDEETGFQRN